MKEENLFIEEKLEDVLTEERIEEYFEKYHQGDMEARNQIIVHNIGLVLNWICKKFGDMSFIDKKDLVSVGFIGLIKSVDAFDIKKNIKFSTFAVRCINNEVLMYLKKEKKHINNKSLNSPICMDENGDEKFLEEILEDPSGDFASNYENKILYKEIRNIIEDLSDREKKIILLYFGFVNDRRYSQLEIADMYNITRSYLPSLVRNSLQEITSKLVKADLIEKSSKRKRKRKINNILENKDTT